MKLIHKSYKFRIYPTKEQESLLSKHFGHCRFVFNKFLNERKEKYLNEKTSLNYYDNARTLTDLKKDDEFLWLKEVNSQSLQASIRNLDIAYKNFFNKQNKFPRFKSKYDRQSFKVPQNVLVEDGKLVIPKFKEGIKIVLHREIKGTIKSATISRTPTGKYFVSILVDTNVEKPIKATINEKTAIGIDLGIKSFIVTSEGEVIDNPKYLRKAQSKLKYVQRKYSKNKGKRTKQRLSLLHEKVVNKRKDFLHKVSTKLICENQTICLEDLAVSNMVKNHKLAQAINDVSWSTFVTMLEYKADWYGKNILRIGRFAPSSKTCNCCGYINKELTLKDREWVCLKCKSVLDRDINAAINIKSFALKNHLSGEHTLKNRGELPTLVGVLIHEAHPIAFGVGG